MKSYQRSSLIAITLTYFLVFIGGLVRVSGAGLGCPDWPKCFGRWIPPMNVSQLPAGFDPNTFNFVLAWIEYINRLVGVIVGFAILLVAILAIRHYRKKPGVLIPSLLAALLVAFQGWQGSRVVASELEPFVVTLHLLLALLIISLLLYAALSASFSQARPVGTFPKQSQRLMAVGWGLSIIVILLGSQVRQGIESMQRVFPLLFDQALLAKVGVIDEIHMLVGIILAMVGALAVWTLKKHSRDLSAFVNQTATAMIILIFLQILLGVILIGVGLKEIFQLLHLWFASLITGLWLVLFVSIKKGGTFSHE